MIYKYLLVGCWLITRTTIINVIVNVNVSLFSKKVHKVVYRDKQINGF